MFEISDINFIFMMLISMFVGYATTKLDYVLGERLRSDKVLKEISSTLKYIQDDLDSLKSSGSYIHDDLDYIGQCIERNIDEEE